MRLFSINLFVLALLAALCAAYRAGYSGGSLSDHATSTKTSRAQPSELVIPGEKIYPESLTSSGDGRVIIGSISTRTIFVVKPGETKAEAWILPDQETTLGIFGVFADNKNHTLWACFASIPGLRGATPAPSAVVAYDLQTGTLKQRYPLPTSNAFCNDIAVGADGSTYVTDSRNMEVDRLQKGGHELQPWAGQGGFGPASGFIDGISVVANRVFVNTLGSGKLFAVPIQPDGSAGTIAEVKLDRTMERPDGMRSFGKSSMLVVESGGVGRLSRLDISGDSGKLTTLKEGFPDGPVSVTQVGTTGYVLEGQLRLLFAPPDPKAVAKPFHATAVEVGRP